MTRDLDYQLHFRPISIISRQDFIGFRTGASVAVRVQVGAYTKQVPSLDSSKSAISSRISATCAFSMGEISMRMSLTLIAVDAIHVPGTGRIAYLPQMDPQDSIIISGRSAASVPV
jgi:hypothetical protein